MYPGARGVTLPANQGRPVNEGTANTVVSAMRCEFVAVEYFDPQGRRIRDVLLKAGDEYYTPPNSVAWTDALKSVKPWLRDGIRQKLPLDAAEGLKVSDNVEILVSNGEAKEGQ